MLIYIESFFFHTFRNTQTEHDVHNFKDDKSHSCSPKSHNQCSKYLST